MRASHEETITLTRSTPRILALALVCVGLLAFTACGDSSDGVDAEPAATPANTEAGTEAGSAAGESGTRTIEIDMRDIAFDPAQVDVSLGETVRFVFANSGAVPHDAFIGDAAAQTDHEMQMQGADGADHMSESSGSGDDGVTVEPGGRGEIVHTFAAGEELIIGCHQPGHYDAGMRISINAL